MVEKLLTNAKEEFTDAINLAFLVFNGSIKCNAEEFLQIYVMLKHWEARLDEKIKNTKNRERKFGYQDMKTVIQFYIDKYDDDLFKQNEDLVLAWMSTKKGLPLTDEEREIVSTFVEVVERKKIDLYPEWRTFIPEL